jgi:hypothetical protein
MGRQPLKPWTGLKSCPALSLAGSPPYLPRELDTVAEPPPDDSKWAQSPMSGGGCPCIWLAQPRSTILHRNSCNPNLISVAHVGLPDRLKIYADVACSSADLCLVQGRSSQILDRHTAKKCASGTSCNCAVSVLQRAQACNQIWMPHDLHIRS